MTKFTTENKLAVCSLYVASYQIAKQRKAHTIGEDLLMLVIKVVVKIMIGEKESKKIECCFIVKQHGEKTHGRHV